MGVAPGSPVSAANTNQAFIDANADDTAVGKYNLENPEAPSGAFQTNIQAEMNGRDKFMGRPTNSGKDSLPTWSNNDVGLSTDDLEVRADNLTGAFNYPAGHTHDLTPGSGGAIASVSIQAVPLRGYVAQGTDLTGVTGTSTVVTTELTGKTPSTNSTTQGVVVSAPDNKIIIRQASGADEDDSFVDGSGNIVYGRLTEAATVWTLSYFVNLSGTETAYSFSSPEDVRWYYQELFNPIVNAPVYSEFAAIPSDNATSDVVDASPTQRGLVSTGTQSFGGNKTFVNDLILEANLRGDVVTDAATTGANATLPAPAKTILRLTNASLSSIDMISGVVNSLLFVIVNKTGNTIALNDETGGTSSQRILTGTGAALNLPNNGTAWIFYDATSTRWMIIGGSGGTISGRAGNNAITNGTSTVSVTFSSALPSTNYAITTTIRNTTDPSPMFIPIAITAKSTTGFTATWNVAVDSANYVLEWSAIINN